MSQLTTLDLIDIIALIVVAGAVVGSLRRDAGLLGAVGSALGAALLVWLAVGAAATWASPGIASAARTSRVATLAPVPQHAFDQAGQLLGLQSPQPADQPAGPPTDQPSERTPR